MTMGTASTMTAMQKLWVYVYPVLVLFPQQILIILECLNVGKRIVEMVWEDLTPRNYNRKIC